MSATLDQCITEHERMMVLQERERCAKIVEQYEWMQPGEWNDSDDPRPGMAALIRKGE
jgi:hypothetical protein